MTGSVRIREATADDRSGIVALCRETFDEFDAAGVTAVLADERFGTDAFWVGEDDGRVVACLGLLSMDLRVGGIAVPTGQPEYVAVAEPYRRRGLVRQMMDLAHERSDARGDLVQLVGGIPYYYRRFGYGWGPAMPSAWRLRNNALPEVEGVRVRLLEEADLETVAPLDAELRRRADLYNTRAQSEWRAMNGLATDELRLWTVERDGRPVAYGAAHVQENGHVRLSDVAATTLDDVTALVRHALDAGGRDCTILGRDRTVVDPWVRSHAFRSVPSVYAWYARVPDPIGLLDHLRPALTARLQNSPLRTVEGEVRFTTYLGGFSLHIEEGHVHGVDAAEPDIDPGPDVVGVAPDLLPGLVFGRHDPLEVQDRQPDLRLGRHAGLVATLFPRQVSHINLWF